MQRTPKYRGSSIIRDGAIIVLILILQSKKTIFWKIAQVRITDLVYRIVSLEIDL